MAEVQEALADKGSSSVEVESAARSSLSRLLDRLLSQSDGGSRPAPYGGDKSSLAHRLGRGLHTLAGQQPSSKGLVTCLQQHFLLFTQRLHAAEVERRSLRVEVTHLRRIARDDHAPHAKDPCHLVPAERFGSVCVELRQALQREQQAQSLLREQAEQLQQLGLRMDLQAEEHTDRQHTLSQAVQSLSEAKQEVRRREQSLRVLGKRVSGLQQEKAGLEESVRHAENALRMVAKSKDSLASYMRAAESSYREVRDGIVQYRSSSTGEDLPPRQLPRMLLELMGPERLLGGPEVAACQSLVSTFSEVYQAACSRIGWLEREVSAHQSHVSALRTELQDACLRDNQNYVPVTESSVTPPLSDPLEPLVNPGAPPPDPVNPSLPQPSPAPSLSAPPRKSKGSKKPPKKTRLPTPKTGPRR